VSIDHTESRCCEVVGLGVLFSTFQCRARGPPDFALRELIRDLSYTSCLVVRRKQKEKRRIGWGWTSIQVPSDPCLATKSDSMFSSSMVHENTLEFCWRM
jgi:hypothetical protein